jgi:ABC-2 type transport system ATP-binding protein
MNAVLEARGLGKRYGRRWALADCDLTIPAGRVVGLVGPNGAGKSTLLQLSVGLLTPSSGEVTVLGGTPAATLGKIGFVAQDAPVYAGMTVADHLRIGAWANDGFDLEGARARVEQLDLPPRQRAGRLSGGQRAQLALTLALAKRPQFLLLDEPVASLDPLARREFLQLLMAAVVEDDISVILSSHLITDLERACDYLVVLAGSHVQVAGPIDELVATHHRLTGPRQRGSQPLPSGLELVTESHTDVQSTLVVRHDTPVLDPAWTVSDVSLEDLVLAYIARDKYTRGKRKAQDPHNTPSARNLKVASS